MLSFHIGHVTLQSQVDCGERDGFEIIDVAIGGVGRSEALSGCVSKSSEPSDVVLPGGNESQEEEF